MSLCPSRGIFSHPLYNWTSKKKCFEDPFLVVNSEFGLREAKGNVNVLYLDSWFVCFTGACGKHKPLKFPSCVSFLLCFPSPKLASHKIHPPPHFNLLQSRISQMQKWHFGFAVTSPPPFPSYLMTPTTSLAQHNLSSQVLQWPTSHWARKHERE